MLRSFHHTEFRAEDLAEAKRGRRVSVCLPARDEAATIGQIVQIVRREVMERVALVDELIVVDDGSTDETAREATAAGARVLAADTILPGSHADPGSGHTEGGKGQAMWKGLYAASGDIIVFCDADIQNFGSHFITGLVGPLLAHEDVLFAKAFYRRPMEGRPHEGGRVTELVARPLISVLFPELAGLQQPLAGECAARRDVLEAVPFVDGYGVDLGLLIDVSNRFGTSAIVQCDLGERIHRNRPLADLGPQAMAILQLALARAGLAPGQTPWHTLLQRPGHEPEVISFAERPPLGQVPAQRKTA